MGRLSRRGQVVIGALALTLTATTGANLARATDVGPPLPHVLPTGVPAFDCSDVAGTPAPTPGPTSAWLAQMPQPRPDVTVRSFQVELPSQIDGTNLAARVYLPTTPSASPVELPLPTVLFSTPYVSQFGNYQEENNDLGVDNNLTPDCFGDFLVRRGYAYVIADMRGTHNSSGCPDFGGPADQADGATWVDWIAHQPWSNGKVGLHGLSWEGAAAWATAAARPANLTSVAVASPTNFYLNNFMGAVPLDQNAAGPAFDAAEIAPPGTRPTSGHWPATVTRNGCEHPDTDARYLSQDGTEDAYWQARDLRLLAPAITAPVLLTAGDTTTDLRRQIPAEWDGLHVTKKAFLGTWPHGYPTTEIPWSYIELRWDEHWLKGNDTGMLAEPAVEVADNQGTVRASDTYPLAGTTLALFPQTGGRLTTTADATFAEDYQDLPGLQHDVIRSADGHRLLYAMAPLAQPLHIAGEARLTLDASIDTTAAHLVALLYDVDGDGNATDLTYGYLDARHRQGEALPGTDIVPGARQRYEITLADTDWTLAAGHHLELVIASSDGCADCARAGAMPSPSPSPATVTVFEGPDATRLALPTS